MAFPNKNRNRLKRETAVLSREVVDALPSVSICIPARRNSRALAICLERILASQYPKLEVIVLAGYSEDSPLSLAQQFARDGVRFVEGQRPSGRRQQHARQRLIDEASGTLVFFMPETTHVEPQLLEDMVERAQRQLGEADANWQRFLVRPARSFRSFRLNQLSDVTPL